MKKFHLFAIVMGLVAFTQNIFAQQYSNVQPTANYQNTAYQQTPPPNQQYTPNQANQGYQNNGYASNPQPPVNNVNQPQYQTQQPMPAGNYNNAPVNYNHAPAPMRITVHSGTPIELETIYPLKGKKLKEGQTIDLRVKYDIAVNGQIVINAGAPARAIVSVAEKNKMFGKGGELQLLPQYVQMVDGQFLPVSGMPSSYEGKNRKALAWGGGIAAGVVTGGIGFLAIPFIKGKNVEIPVGTSINCSVLGSRTIAVYNYR